jgi:hypothetical protein
MRSLGLRCSPDLLRANSMIGNATILIDSRGARVKLEHVELDEMNQVVSVRPGEFRLRHGANGVVAEP